MLIHFEGKDRYCQGAFKKEMGKTKIRLIQNQYSKTKKKFFYLKISFSKFPSDLLTTQTIPKKLPLRGSEKESVV